MDDARPRPCTAAGASVATGLCLLLAACEAPPPPDTHQGWVEGEFVRVASPYTGTLEKLLVHRGQQVQAKAPLFELEHERERTGRDEAENRLRTAQARLDNLLGGKRRPELDVVRAQLAQAQAAKDLSAAELKRQQKLFSEGFISGDHMDAARTGFTRDSARVQELRAQIESSRLSIGREDEIKAAEGEVAAARAVLARRDWDLRQKSVQAPVAALVHDTYFAEGEWVPAGAPVASLLPPANLKIRFYLPQPLLGAVRLGQEVSVACDGCAAPVKAQVSYVSRQAEYTPPVIYSENSRAKLMYLVEARPVAGAALHVGQPVDVRLAAAAR